MMTQAQLVRFSSLDRGKLYKLMFNRSLRGVAIFRNETQRALAEYARNNKFDAVQMDTVDKLARIDMWLWDAFKKTEWGSLLKSEPKYLTLGKKAAKCELRKRYESWITSITY